MMEPIELCRAVIEAQAHVASVGREIRSVDDGRSFGCVREVLKDRHGREVHQADRVLLVVRVHRHELRTGVEVGTAHPSHQIQ